MALGVLGATPASATPSETAAVSAQPHAAQSRCLVWHKTTTNYSGLTAGYSWAWTVVVSPGATGDRVKEIQCLTDYHGDGPSALDGSYGPDTKAAVKRSQKRCGLKQDGIVGPDTWRCLRDA
ncbi:peptidoglycan-binding protein [Streptomyces sp. NPDC088725]|uniref:peptidoglycan-binding domain-containing protein n=1 Tax=Streptomyces sp. NPDC088725 TaxID=3365873 RepID=UPI00382F5EEE